MKKTIFKFFQAFPFAFSGIKKAVKKERNLKFHLLVALLIIIFGFVLKITRTEWLILVLIMAAVLSAEIFNSALEGICDLLKEENNLGYQRTKFIRDASAGAVLILALASVIIGLIIFLPYF